MTKVLVAEDERRIRELLVDTLFDLGFDVLEASDGGEAFKTAYNEVPDLILLDLMMPVMDGIEVLTRLRETAETKSIPVIVLSALAAVEREKDAYELGVSHYISKPFDPDTLDTTIKVALKEARTVAGDDDGFDSSDASSKVWGGSTSYQSLPGDNKDTDYIRLGESLTVLEKKLGGGIRLGTVTLLVGASGTGKSVLCQTAACGAIENGHGVAYFTSQLTPRRMESQIASLGLNLPKDKGFGVFPVPEPVLGEDSGPLLTDLAMELDRTSGQHGLIIVDAITSIASTCQDNAIMGFFSNCKRICNKGRTIVVVTHSSALSADLLGRATSLCETMMKFSTGKVRERAVRKAELLKVNDIDLDQDNVIAFDVQPDLGFTIIPYSQAKA